MRASLLGAAALLVAGVALIALSVAQGGASVALVVIIPVVSGSSATFLAGVVLLLVSFVALALAFSGGWEEEPPLPARGTAPAAPAPRSGGAGGFVLIGPVPIVFGSWRGVSRKVRALLALVGAVILIVVVLAFVWLVR